jgi:hypothetical protein
MIQLETSKPIVEEEQKYKREYKGRALAISRRNYRLHNSDVYYIESEGSNNTYYFMKFKPDVYTYVHTQIIHERNEMQALILDIIRYHTGHLKDLQLKYKYLRG